MDSIDIDPHDLRIDTYRNSFRGFSFVRITHLPTGIIVECGDERARNKNKEKAMQILKAKLKDTVKK